MSYLYFMSAVSGFGSVALIGSGATLTTMGVSMSWNVIGWVLLGVSIGVGIFIALFGSNPLEEWVENSIWGVDAIYKGYEKDIQEYQKAIQEMGG